MAKASKARSAWLSDPDSMDYGLGTMPPQNTMPQPWAGVGHTPGVGGQSSPMAERPGAQVPMRAGQSRVEQARPQNVSRPKFTMPMRAKKQGVQKPNGNGGPGTGTGEAG